MLRGSSRHDGIPNKQSAKDRDRDRQREQQRKERAQMLPDDKEIHASTQDLFHAPVKVKPSVEDTTTVQIRNTLGSFDTVRHLMIDPGSSKRLADLVGVDQRGPTSTQIQVTSHRLSNQIVDRLPNSGSVPSSFSTGTDSNSTKSHYSRNLYPVNHHTSGISNNITQTATSSSGSSLSTTSFRNSTNPSPIPPIPVQKVPHSQNQLPQHNTIVFNSNTNLSTPVPITPNSGPILNIRSPNLSNNQVRLKQNTNYGNTSNAISVSVDVNLDGASGSSSSEKHNSVFNNEPIVNNSVSARNDKSSKSSVQCKKPSLERADSQLELESMLKEMMDVTPPLTAIQTPVKENITTKKLPQRRSSKSEEKIVQSIINSGMANVPSPVKRMDSSDGSSSSYESDTDSESEDSSSGSHPSGDKLDILAVQVPPSTSSPTTRWNLGSFLKNTVESSGKPGTKSPKDGKSNSYGSLDFEPLEDLTAHPDRGDSVTSTNKSQSTSPLESGSIPNTNIATRAKLPGRSRVTPDTRPETNIPPRQIPPSIPSKGPASSNNKISSLTASSSDDEVDIKPKKPVVSKSLPLDEKKAPVVVPTTRKRPRQAAQSSSSSTRHTNKSDGDSSPETNPSKSSKNGQDKNKTDTIRKLFRFGTTNKPSGKVESPNLQDSDPSKTNNGTTNLTSITGKQAAVAPNRVSAKGNPSSVAHNGDLGPSDKKKDGPKEKGTANPQGRKHPKLSTTSHAKSLISPETASTVPSGPLLKIKEEITAKSSSSPSSLIVRIPLEKLKRKPPLASTSLPTTIISPTVSKNEKELEKANKGIIAAAAGAVTNADSYRLKVPHNSSRVGSSSDPTNQPFPVHDLGIARDRDDPMCSDSERLSSKTHSNKKKPKKRSRASPKKTKIKREAPDFHIKVEEDLAYGEVSSNVLGYVPCDNVAVSTTRTPPIDADAIQAPDSSLNPSQLPSFISPQVVYFSYFEKSDHKEDLFSRDQDSYLEEAKKLKHSADGERTSTTQASMYLEAGLYFILTGILMERDSGPNSLVTSNAPYTMYKDTLNLIQYIGSRWRSRSEMHNLVEAKIIILSMRCQALLFLKLFKIKMKETKDMVHNMQEYFTKAAPRDALTISNSPQLSTPSPHSPTSSPAGSSGVLGHTPSPHHPHQQNHLVPTSTIPRGLHAQIHKHCGNTYNVIMAHDTWEQADGYVAKYRIEDFFIGIDRQFGPLTLHSSLVDLVRYVRHGLQLINGS